MNDKCDKCGARIQLANYKLHPAETPTDKRKFFESKVRCFKCGHFNLRVIEVNSER